MQLALQTVAQYCQKLPSTSDQSNVTYQVFSSLKKQGVDTLITVLNRWFEWE